jgi:hypothetical protein
VVVELRTRYAIVQVLVSSGVRVSKNPPSRTPQVGTCLTAAPSRLFQAVWDGVLLLLVAIFMYIAFVRSVDLNWGPRSKECLMVGGRFPFVRFHMGEECFVGGPGE